MKEGYLPKDQRKRILLICDDIRLTSGIATVAREIVIGTAHHFNWINIGGTINHPDKGKRFDLSEDTNKQTGLTDASVTLYPIDGYGTPDFIRGAMVAERPDAMMFITDPRYFAWLFQMEHEIRQRVPMIYLNIWDDLPYPMYNKSFYESCDTLMAISKQTENINKIVLGEMVSEKIIKYVPHGINAKHFYPVISGTPEGLALDEIKKDIFKEVKPEFALFYNARNIRRKSVPDLMLGWKQFMDELPKEKAEKCFLLLHTKGVDDPGTNLFDVADMLFGNDEYNIIFSEHVLATSVINLLYNACDCTILISSNEGWGLSLTESMMCGKPIIANVTGGMQDQMRFEDENGNWIKFTEEFGSNHRGKYKKHGDWAFPVFPSNISLIGSPPTPYIFDDRCSYEDIGKAIKKAYECKMNTPEIWERKGQVGREWVTSDEAMMTAEWMCKNVISTMDETFKKWEPRYKWEITEIVGKVIPRHYNKYPIPQ